MTLSIDPKLPNVQRTHEPRFAIGELTATPGALACLEKAGVNLFALLGRHIYGDWGDALDPADCQANEDGLREGGRVMSAYHVGDARIWVITEADRSATTFLLPAEY